MSTLHEPPFLSVVIRTRGEEKYLQTLLSALSDQTIKNIEIVLVVDYSQLSTWRKMLRFKVDKLVGLEHEDFNHAYSTNLGVAASHAELVAITNGHSLPITNRWLEAGVRHFTNEKVAGVTGLSTPGSDGSFWEKLYFTPLSLVVYRNHWCKSLLESSNYFLFSTTNCIIRKSLWHDYPFDESLPQCEDYDWGKEMRARGYTTLIDPDFSVFHSHGDGLARLWGRRREWEKTTHIITDRPRPRISFTQLHAEPMSHPEKLSSFAG